MATSQYNDLAGMKSALTRGLGDLEHSKLTPSEEQQEDAIRDALDELSGVRPRTRVHEEAGDGSIRHWTLSSMITGWLDGESSVLQLDLVTDAGTDGEDKQTKDEADWEVRPNTGDQEELWVDEAPAASETLRVFWGGAHTLEDLDGATATTLTANLKQPLLLLALERLARLVSRKASDMADHSMGVDQVDFTDFSRRWRDRAKELRELAAERLAPSELAAAAGAWAEWESTSRLTKTRISH